MNKKIRELMKEFNFFSNLQKEDERLKEDLTYRSHVEQLQLQIDAHSIIIGKIYNTDGSLKEDAELNVIERLNRSISAINKTEKLLRNDLKEITGSSRYDEEEDPLANI